jgi:hypothetical protein
MVPLLEEGYQTLEYKWIQDGGWLESKSNGGDPSDQTAWMGLKAAACRQDNLMRRLRAQHHPDPTGNTFPYCATGQSGGAAQLAYALTYHDAEAYLDSVVLTSGPVFADIEFGCKEVDDCSVPGAHPGCYGTEQECLIDQAYGNEELDCRAITMSVGPCEDLDDDPDWLEQADRDGLVPDMPDPAEMPDHDYPFAVHFVFGQDDGTEAPPHGMKYRAALREGDVDPPFKTSCRSVVGVPHGVPSGDFNDDPDGDGPDAVLVRLQTYCESNPPDVTSTIEEDEECSAHHPNPVP